MLKMQAFLVAAVLIWLSCCVFVGEVKAQELSLVSQARMEGSLNQSFKSAGAAGAKFSEAVYADQPYSSNMRVMGPETDKGYVVVQLGLYFGKRVQEQEENVLVSPSLQLSGGYRIRHWLQLGMGTGIEKYGRVQINPVFAEFRGTVLDQFFSPYYAMRFGGAFADLQNDSRYQKARGGLMAEGQVGVAFRFGHLSWLVGTGYRVQQVKLEGTFQGWLGEHSRLQYRDYRRLAATTSFRFTF